MSVLGGRVFFKGIRYHGQNETILINEGYITWRYWLRHVRDANLTPSGKKNRARRKSKTSNSSKDEPAATVEEQEDPKLTQDLPCRITANIRGLEWFVYNRSPAYDAVLAALLKSEDSEEQSYGSASEKETKGSAHDSNKPSRVLSHETVSSFSAGGNASLGGRRGDPEKSSTFPNPIAEGQDSSSFQRSRSTTPTLLKMFPVGIGCAKGAMVMGNEHTHCVLVAKFSKASGRIDASAAGPQDRFKQMFDFDFEQPVVQFKLNNDFKESQQSAGIRSTKDEKVDRGAGGNNSVISRFKRHHKRVAHGIQQSLPFLRKSVESFLGVSSFNTNQKTPPNLQLGVAEQSRWLGLSRYLDEDNDTGHIEQERWKAIEYGQVNTILDCKSIGMSFFWDVPGPVLPVFQEGWDELYKTQDKDINGCQPPDWGLDLRIGGGVINYGPWADRQRVDLQTVFFPSSFADVPSAMPLKPGQLRISTRFKIVIVLESQVTLRIYTREESKDWKWKSHLAKLADAEKDQRKKAHAKGRKNGKASLSPDIRPAGWLELTVAADSCVTYLMDMVAHEAGYRNSLDLDIKTPYMSSSANHDLMWRSKCLTMTCDLSYPRGWNSLREWKFNVMGDEFELFILRDHAFLLTDLVNDWTAGPPGAFLTFIPFIYYLNLQFPKLKVYFNANDSNIIDKPSALDDNAFIMISSYLLTANIRIPLQNYRPLNNTLTFDVDAVQMGLQLITPIWNTQNTFVKDRSFAKLEELSVQGSYNYFSTTSSSLTDTLSLDIHGNIFSMHVYGFLIRYFMTFKDNYFGEDLHFQTLEEHQQRVGSSGGIQGREDVHTPKPTNDLDVILSITADDLCFILPAHLYSATDNVKGDVSSIALDLRFTNYYMDIELASSPLALTRGLVDDENLTKSVDSNTQAFVDGITVVGHRLFGLPPSEPTYVCNWDFAIGEISGESSLEFFATLVSAVKYLNFQFKDVENALSKQNPLVIHDITFLCAQIQPVTLWLHVEHSVFLLSTGLISFDFNDWANTKFSERLHLAIPQLVLASMDSPSPSQTRGRGYHDLATHAYLQTAVDVKMLESEASSEQQTQLQQDHLYLHDSRTHRTPWLININEQILSQRPDHTQKPRQPAMPFPPMPCPLKDHGDRQGISQTSLSSRSLSTRSTLNRKSSFLSMNSAPGHRKPRQHAATNPQSSHQGELGSDIAMLTSDRRAKANSRAPPAAQGPLRNNSSTLGRLGTGLAVSNVTFSSAYDKPYFPLYTLRPDTSDVPLLEEVTKPNLSIRSEENLIDSVPPVDQGAVWTTLMIHLGSGIRALCTPEALSHLNSLLSGLRPLHPENILDDLQVNTVTRVVEKSEGTPVPKVLQVRLDVPLAAIRFNGQTRDSHTSVEYHQTYDLNAKGLNVTARVRSLETVEDREQETQPSSIHSSLQRLKFVAKAAIDQESGDLARIEATLDTTTIWLVKNQGISGQVQTKGLEIRTLNRRAEYLAALISNTIMLSESLNAQFRDAAAIHEQCTQRLILLLATHERKVPDPVFLTTASYVLRAASSHPRSSDTWKMISHLRSVLQHLASKERHGLVKGCLDSDLASRSDAMNQVIRALKKWRSWDLLDVRSSLLMQEVYGPLPTNEMIPVMLSDPLKVNLNLSSFGLVVDPGPKQIELQFQSLAISLIAKMSKQGGPTEDHVIVRDSKLEVFCMNTLVHLNWDILGLIEGFLQVFLTNVSPRAPRSTVSPVKEQASILKNFHIVSVIENADASFTSNNLKTRYLGKSLAVSSSITQKPLSETLFTIIINANIVAMDLSSNVASIMTIRLQQPTLQGSLETRQLENTVFKSWSLGALCSRLDFDIREDVLGLLSIADLLIGDEITYLMNLVAKIKSFLRSHVTDATIASSPQTATKNTFHVALILETYSISTVLLSSLKAVTHGKVARSSVKSSLGISERLTIDFDLKNHGYTFENSIDGSIQEISSLFLPPINGEIILSKKDRNTAVDAFVTVEKISLDASAVHALFSTFSRREFSDMKRSISREMALVQADYQALVQKMARENESHGMEAVSDDSFLYSAHVSVAGSSITASTGKTSKQAALLLLELERIHFSIANKSKNSRQALAFAEIVMGVQEIKVILQRIDGKESRPCGDVTFAVSFSGTSRQNEHGQVMQSFEVKTNYLEVNIYPETASMIVDILGYLQQRFKSFNLTDEINTLRARHHRSKSRAKSLSALEAQGIQSDSSTALFTSMYSLEVDGIQISWRVGDLTPISPGHEVEDLVFSIEKIHLATKKANAARLLMRNLQLQMVPTSQSTKVRSRNSALMPEVMFNVAYLSTQKDRRLAFQAIGKSVDLRLTSQFILPATDLQRSIGLATRDLRKVLADWNTSFVQDEQENKKLLGNKKLASVLIDADFAGAVVYLQGKKASDPQSMTRTMLQASRFPRSSISGHSGYEDTAVTTVLRTPGIALKVEYKNLEHDDPALNTEIKINASSNTLQPTIVPLIMELSSSVKEIVGEHEEALRGSLDQKSSPTKILDENVLQSTNPVAILGNCRLNLGLRICRQEFGLSCQPIAKVAAAAQFDDIYITVNTVQAADQTRFFAISAVITHLEASVQHAYSRESTGSFKVGSIELSLMNSKHVSNAKGISAILKFSPMDVLVNAKQLHDFLIFREVWLPMEIRQSKSASETPSNESHPFDVQRYQQVAATGAFPWNATISIEKLDVLLDLGQSLGKASFVVSRLWVSSRKHSDWEQDLCLGFDNIGIDSVGRMSGTVGLHNLRLRTSIRWPDKQQLKYQTPLIQASLSFDDFQAKAAFEYQAFLVADLSSLEFLMHNVRDGAELGGDRLVCTVSSDKVQAFCTTQSSASALAIYQAVQRLIQEKRLAYENSLSEIELYYYRKVSTVDSNVSPTSKESNESSLTFNKTPLQLQTNVVVSLKAINVGVYPKSFSDGTIFKLEALDAGARFSVILEAQKVRSALGLQLGQVRIALSSVPARNDSRALEDLMVDEVIKHSVGSRGGTILKVPRVIATMQTRQDPKSTHIDYMFRSSFEGKVEVGWNINRINFIRGMLNSHSRALAHRLGKALPQSAVQITGVPQPGEASDQKSQTKEKENEKITAVVNVPLSKYSYSALEPPIIQTPQLRDMGEATPPLEWIGLHRERLPNLTHQIIIVPLLEITKEVEDAYSKILGSA